MYTIACMKLPRSGRGWYGTTATLARGERIQPEGSRQLGQIAESNRDVPSQPELCYRFVHSSVKEYTRAAKIVFRLAPTFHNPIFELSVKNK